MEIVSSTDTLTTFNMAYALSLMAFVFSVSITPGPNNLMLTASGIRFGFWRTMPHLLGVCVGFVGLCLLVVLGLGGLFLQYPVLQTVLKVLGSAYLLYLAYKIIRSSSPKAASADDKPFSFYQALAFQVVNPKAWTMAITGFSAFSLPGESLMVSGLAVVLAFALVTPVCVVAWTITGSQISRFIANEVYLRWFNYTLGGLTAACVLLILA